MNTYKWPRTGWGKTLTAEQRATIRSIRIAASPGRHRNAKDGTDGWTVYMMPSVGPAVYCELRHHLTGGGIARWVIERDGSVSSDNDQGLLRELRAA